MSYIRLANFIKLERVKDNGDLQVEGRYNNGVPGDSVTLRGDTYQYLSFIYQGAAKNRTGDNLEAQLVMSSNAISMDIAQEAVKKKFHVTVFSCLMNDNNSVNKILTTENWIAASMTYDSATLEVILSSGIDAVGANAPTGVLTRKQVGSLPVTGNINAQ